MLVGYARCSTEGQDLTLQLERLNAVKIGEETISKVFSDKLSGKDRKRPGLEDMLEYVREGDKVVITKLDRLARSLEDMLSISGELKRKRVQLVVLDQQIDTSTAMGEMFFVLLGAFAQFERAMINERTAAGREAAIQRGVKFGRKRTLSEQDKVAARQAKTAGESLAAIAKRFGVGRTTIYRAILDQSDTPDPTPSQTPGS